MPSHCKAFASEGVWLFQHLRIRGEPLQLVTALPLLLITGAVNNFGMVNRVDGSEQTQYGSG